MEKDNIIYKAKKSYFYLISSFLALVALGFLSHSFSDKMNTTSVFYIYLIMLATIIFTVFALYNNKLFITKKGIMAKSLTKKVIIDFKDYDEYVLYKPKDRLFGSVDFVFEDKYSKVRIPFVLEEDFIENLKNTHQDNIKITVKNKEYH